MDSGLLAELEAGQVPAPLSSASNAVQPSLKQLQRVVAADLDAVALADRAASNHCAAWSIFSNGQSVENMMRSAPTTSMASISAGVWKLPDVVTWKLAQKYSRMRLLGRIAVAVLDPGIGVVDAPQRERAGSRPYGRE